jgi:PAS domain S-box-containing protein
MFIASTIFLSVMIGIFVLFWHQIKLLRTREERISELNNDLRKQGELLETKNTFLVAILNALPDAVAVADADRKLFLVNQGMANMFGYSKQELVGMCTSSFYASQDDFESVGKIRMSLDQPFEFEYDMVRKDGSVFPAKFYGLRILNTQSEPSAFLSVAYDLTESVASRNALLESKAKYRSLSEKLQFVLDSFTDVVCLVSSDMKIVWANSAAEAEACDCEEIVGMSCERLWQNTNPSIRQLLTASFDSGRIEEGIVTADYGQIWGVKIFPASDEGIAFENVLLVASNVTEKVELRETISRSKKLATLGQIAVGVAHEINNPVGVIKFNISLFNDLWADINTLLRSINNDCNTILDRGSAIDQIRSEGNELISDIESSISKIDRIVSELKSSSQEREMHKTPTDLVALLQNCNRFLARDIENLTNHFALSIEDEIPLVVLDQVKIEQVVVNLIQNALQALTDIDQGVEVSLKVDRKKKIVLLSVVDQGSGISEEDIERVSEPFYTTKRNQGGCGLGLYVVSQIIDGHSGQLEVKSELGSGSEFVVKIPYYEG